ncbi:MAG: lysophospholipid acyltransferase family protein [Candidatus Binatia bacterium]
MSNACCAAPDALPIRRRLRRLTALLLLLGRMWLAAVTRAARLDAARRRALAGRWARRLLALLRIEVRVSGSVPPVDEPLLLVANHVSWLDSYALNAVNGARFVAKSEVAAWPVIGTIAARFGTVFIKRGCYRAAARTVGVLAEALGGGHPMAVFPEATTSDGRGLRPFYPALFQAAVRSGAWVQPVAICYRDAAGAPTDAAAYVGDMSIADSLRRLLREPRLIVELTFCPPIDSDARTRRELAAEAREHIAAALGLVEDRPLQRAA